MNEVYTLLRFYFYDTLRISICLSSESSWETVLANVDGEATEYRRVVAPRMTLPLQSQIMYKQSQERIQVHNVTHVLDVFLEG